MMTNEDYMRLALSEARKAFELGETPVGAILVFEQKIIAKTHNQTEILNDPTAHAEMLAVTAACTAVGSRYLNNCKLFVTVEPCPMCAGALYWSQMGEVFWAADDEKRGFSKFSPSVLHPHTRINKHVCKEEAEKLMKDFFKRLRKPKKLD
jgi:tRNA(adenine34) deaminase